MSQVTMIICNRKVQCKKVHWRDAKRMMNTLPVQMPSTAEYLLIDHKRKIIVNAQSIMNVNREKLKARGYLVYEIF